MHISYSCVWFSAVHEAYANIFGDYPNQTVKISQLNSNCTYVCTLTILEDDIITFAAIKLHNCLICK